jgi:hypothetical protein
MPTHSQAIHAYIRAKDENRPHLMKRAFAETANLEIIVETGVISFPPLSRGLDAITQVLVRDFGQRFENVYTFCLAHPPKSDDGRFSCHWLVGMSEKKSGAVRVGCGRYDWLFETNDPCLVERLKITVNDMQVLSPDCLRPVMDWLSNLPYPWCPADEAINGIPDLAGLKPIFNFIDRNRI